MTDDICDIIIQIKHQGINNIIRQRQRQQTTPTVANIEETSSIDEEYKDEEVCDDECKDEGVCESGITSTTAASNSSDDDDADDDDDVIICIENNPDYGTVKGPPLSGQNRTLPSCL